MYRVALCEDEKIFRDEHERICRDIFMKLNIEHKISVFASSGDFSAAFSGERKRYDLLLLDILMDGMNGMELARAVRETDKDAVIIFITSSREFVFEGYDVNAFHYLIKPIDAVVLERLIKAAYNEKFQSSFFVFKSGAQNIRVPVEDIIALETAGRRVEVTLPDKTLHYPGKLTELLAELPKGCFARCHQSFAVNVANIRELTRFEAISINGKKIPISRPFMKDLQRLFLIHMQKES